MKSLGQIGYEAYAKSTGGKTYDGRDMPTWEQVQERTPKVAQAWEDAGIAMRHGLAGSVRTPDARFPFSVALEHLKSGRRVAREGWNGKGMWVALTPGSLIAASQARAGAAQHLADSLRMVSGEPDGAIRILPHVDMRTAQGDLQPGWLVSQTDMLAEDWMVLP